MDQTAIPKSPISITLSRHIFPVAAMLASIASATAEEKISFNKHIRPIFISKCTKCHGGAKADGDLSLIYRSEVLGKAKSGKTIIVPGKPEESELYRRIITDDLDDKMPLQKGDHAEEPLPPEQTELIKKWIEQGAQWEEHWAYIAPKKQPSPSLKTPSWVRQPMDQFVLARIEQHDLTPAAEASRAEWLRRASLDLTGLPPTPQELAAFQANQSADAYEKETDRLLGSKHFGERWASVWMDLARYSDTMGYEKDPHRNIWPYRDYLINAFNQDKPYDQFIREQLAGDLFAKPTAESLIATAFHRNTQTNTEGGTDDEEFRIASTIDRVNTTWTSMQGLTYGCIQCHAHPYEPIPHEDYYRFMDFFNSTEDADLDNDFPQFKVANNPAQRDQAADLYQQIPKLRAAINEPGKKMMLETKSWDPIKVTEAKSTHGKIQAYPTGELHTSGTLAVQTRFDITARTQNFTALHVTITPEIENAAELPERGSVISHLIAHKIKADGTKVAIAMNYVFADHLTGPYDPTESIRGGGAGFGGYPKLFRPRQAVLIPTEPVVFEENEHLLIQIYHGASTTGNQACTLRRFKLQTSNNAAWAQLLKSTEHQQALQRYNQAKHAYNAIKGTSIPVIKERNKDAARETRLFIGGLWLNKGKVYQYGVPKLLNGYQDKVDNRLEMAQWISSNKNSLTARVMVNRLFSELFGRGIVETLGDFGSTGTAPTNRPLLDHLAVQFQDDYKWSVKSILREMVLSAAYRQTHKATAELAKKDPLNHLLARGPRNRLSAEMVRDNALAVSGLITHKLGGPSVMPPQPDGIWSTVYSGASWKNATGADRYRRAVYTYWKRTSPYPSMITFDAPTRDVCSPQRIATNTPLHALVTLNDPVFLECSQAFARRMQAAAGEDISKQIAHGYKLATQKDPSAETVKLLTGLYQKFLTNYTADPALAKSVGDNSTHAALTVIANTILNLDAAQTK